MKGEKKGLPDCMGSTTRGYLFIREDHRLSRVSPCIRSKNPIHLLQRDKDTGHRKIFSVCPVRILGGTESDVQAARNVAQDTEARQAAGNAVDVATSKWLANRLVAPPTRGFTVPEQDEREEAAWVRCSTVWPSAAFDDGLGPVKVHQTEFPMGLRPLTEADYERVKGAELSATDTQSLLTKIHRKREDDLRTIRTMAQSGHPGALISSWQLSQSSRVPKSVRVFVDGHEERATLVSFDSDTLETLVQYQGEGHVRRLRLWQEEVKPGLGQGVQWTETSKSCEFCDNFTIDWDPKWTKQKRDTEGQSLRRHRKKCRVSP